MGGYTFWSEPVTANPRCFTAAAAEAIAVPQMPTKWRDLISENIAHDDRQSGGAEKEEFSQTAFALRWKLDTEAETPPPRTGDRPRRTCALEKTLARRLTPDVGSRLVSAKPMKRSRSCFAILVAALTCTALFTSSAQAG